MMSSSTYVRDRTVRSRTRALKAPLPRSLVAGRAPEGRRRAAVGLLECGAEMAVAVEAEVETQRCQVVVLRQEIERARQSQPHLVAIQRKAFDLLKDLRQINGRMAGVGGD